MSFTKIRPGGFAANSKLLSSEMTALDTDHANAVDKSGDVLTGNVHVGTGAFVTVDTGGSVAWTGSSTATFVGTSSMSFATGTAVSLASGASITLASGASATVAATCTFTSGGTAAWTGSSTATFVGTSSMSFATGTAVSLASGASATVAGSYTFTSGGTLNMNTGTAATFNTGAAAVFNTGAIVAFNVGSTATFLSTPGFTAGATFSGTTAVALGSPLSVVAGGSVTTAAGGSGIVLGNSDYVALSGGHPGRTVTRRIQLAACPFNAFGCTAGIATSSTGVFCSTTTAGQIDFFLPLLWNGATISTFTLYATPNAGHTASPTMPTVALISSAGIAAGAAYPGMFYVGATGTFAYTTWNDSLVHAVTVSVAAVVNANNIYILHVTPESGANAIANMAFHAVDINYTIADLRPQ